MLKGRRAVPVPSGMDKPGAVLWKKLQPAYGIVDEAGLQLLEMACRAWCTVLQAEEQLRRDGLVIKGDRGVMKAHPAAAIARDARSGMLQAFRVLSIGGPEA
jgi:P27 family predicted phage terminase small subunit